MKAASGPPSNRESSASNAGPTSVFGIAADPASLGVLEEGVLRKWRLTPGEDKAILGAVQAELDRRLDEAILEILSEGMASGNYLARCLERRRGEVLAALRRMETSGRVLRFGGSSGWWLRPS